jgi:hypothetical protein
MDEQNIIDFLREVLNEYRDKCIPEGIKANDDKWDDICTVMAWLEEDYKNPTHFD